MRFSALVQSVARALEVNAIVESLRVRLGDQALDPAKATQDVDALASDAIVAWRDETDRLAQRADRADRPFGTVKGDVRRAAQLKAGLPRAYRDLIDRIETRADVVKKAYGNPPKQSPASDTPPTRTQTVHAPHDSEKAPEERPIMPPVAEFWRTVETAKAKLDTESQTLDRDLGVILQKLRVQRVERLENLQSRISSKLDGSTWLVTGGAYFVMSTVGLLHALSYYYLHGFDVTPYLETADLLTIGVTRAMWTVPITIAAAIIGFLLFRSPHTERGAICLSADRIDLVEYVIGPHGATALVAILCLAAWVSGGLAYWQDVGAPSIQTMQLRSRKAPVPDLRILGATSNYLIVKKGDSESAVVAGVPKDEVVCVTDASADALLCGADVVATEGYEGSHWTDSSDCRGMFNSVAFMLQGMRTRDLGMRNAVPPQQFAEAFLGCGDDRELVTYEASVASFSPNGASLPDGGSIDLSALGRLQTQIRLTPTTSVNVVGFADAKGGAAHNLSLSDARADAVGNYVAAHWPGLHRNQIRKFGMGETIRLDADTDDEAETRRSVAIFVCDKLLGELVATSQ